VVIPGTGASSSALGASFRPTSIASKWLRTQEASTCVTGSSGRVLIAPMAQMFLIGTEIDYETGLLESGFRFRNPNVTESCGCGESVKFKDAEAG
jgi:iron-sulfur cluster assembly accessory protein